MKQGMRFVYRCLKSENEIEENRGEIKIIVFVYNLKARLAVPYRAGT